MTVSQDTTRPGLAKCEGCDKPTRNRLVHANGYATREVVPLCEDCGASALENNPEWWSRLAPVRPS